MKSRQNQKIVAQNSSILVDSFGAIFTTLSGNTPNTTPVLKSVYNYPPSRPSLVSTHNNLRSASSENSLPINNGNRPRRTQNSFCNLFSCLNPAKICRNSREL